MPQNLLNRLINTDTKGIVKTQATISLLLE